MRQAVYCFTEEKTLRVDGDEQNLTLAEWNLIVPGAIGTCDRGCTDPVISC